MLLGDGAAGFSLMDVESLVRQKLPVVIVVGNNGIWGLEKHPMRAMYGYDVAADLQPGLRYDEVVKALGGAGETVREPRRPRPGARAGPSRPACRTWSTCSPTRPTLPALVQPGLMAAGPAGEPVAVDDRAGDAAGRHRAAVLGESHLEGEPSGRPVDQLGLGVDGAADRAGRRWSSSTWVPTVVWPGVSEAAAARTVAASARASARGVPRTSTSPEPRARAVSASVTVIVTLAESVGSPTRAR